MSDLALTTALDEAVSRYVDAPACKAHRAFIGLRKVNGQYTDDICVVVCVPDKVPLSALSSGEAIPPALKVFVGMQDDADVFGEVTVPIDVQAEPPAEIKLLRLGCAESYAATTHRDCQSPLIGGGSQIQPSGANWVGTLGGMVVSEMQVVALTNAHVTGLGRAEHWPMHQPAATNPHYFSLVRRVVPITMGSGGRNVVDLAILDPRDKHGKHTVKPEQIGIGRLGGGIANALIGMNVTKSGRTTGVTQGRCVGVKGVVQVGYDAGKVGRFIDQNIFESVGGAFSAAGDSGSFILEQGTNNFVALLFAGGGSQTIGNPAMHVMEAAKATMYQ